MAELHFPLLTNAYVIFKKIKNGQYHPLQCSINLGGICDCGDFDSESALADYAVDQAEINKLCNGYWKKLFPNSNGILTDFQQVENMVSFSRTSARLLKTKVVPIPFHPIQEVGL